MLTTPILPWCKHFGDCPKCSCNGPFICPSCDLELEEVCESVGNQRMCDHEFDCRDCVCEPRWDDETFDEVFRVNMEWLGRVDYPVIALYRSEMEVKDIAANLELPPHVISAILLHFAFVAKGISISAKPGRRDGEDLNDFEAKNLLRSIKRGDSLADVAKMHERSQLSVASVAVSGGAVRLNSSSISQRAVGETVRQGWNPEDVAKVETLLEGKMTLDKISKDTGRPISEVLELVMKHELAKPTIWLSEFKKTYVPFEPYPNLPSYFRRN